MKKTVMKKWVSALRSGKYKQGAGQLRDSDDQFCCLGVLCDLHRRETGRGRWRKGTYFCDDDCHYEVAPDAVADWAGLNERNPILPRAFASGSLAGLNDAGEEFADIADHIEELWREL
jgi:hypothetical protein